MHNANDEVRCTRAQGGFTLVESLIAALLTAALLGMVSTTVASVSSVSRDNVGALRQESRRRDVLSSMRADLRATTLNGTGPIVAADGRSIRFSTLQGATQVAGEVTGIWSSPIEFALEDGRVLRRQDGITVELARGIGDLVFRRPLGESFIEVTCVTRYRGEDTTRSIRIYPNN